MPVAPAPGVSTPSSQAATDAARSASRRRGPGHVTVNACDQCRVKRAKCDGRSPCGRCETHNQGHCTYTQRSQKSKQSLRDDVQSLQSQLSSHESILQALTQSEFSQKILLRLQDGQTAADIARWLEDDASDNADHPEAASNIDDLDSQFKFGLDMKRIESTEQDEPQRIPSSTTSQSENLSSNITTPLPDAGNSGADAKAAWSFSPLEHNILSEQDPAGPAQNLFPSDIAEVFSGLGHWTAVTSDIRQVRHYLALYFCWEYPIFAPLSKQHFLSDFQTGRDRYCSPILVNALLALGCRLSQVPIAEADSRSFFNESQRLFSLEPDHHSVTTIQALVLCSIWETNYGRDAESQYFAGQAVRLASEVMLQHTDETADEDDRAVRAATFWGAFALHNVWSLIDGSQPHYSCYVKFPPKLQVTNSIESSLWAPYTDNGISLQHPCTQPSNLRSVANFFCGLNELVHRSLCKIRLPGKLTTAKELLGIYTEYLDWYARVPEVLRLGYNSTPAVIFVHVYYHFAVLLLLRPFISLRILGSELSPRQACLQAIDAIEALVSSYTQLYTADITPALMPYFATTAAATRLAFYSGTLYEVSMSAHDPITNTAKTRSDYIALAVEMAPHQDFRDRAVSTLNYLAERPDVIMDDGKTPKFIHAALEPSLEGLNPSVSGADAGAANMFRWGIYNDPFTTTHVPSSHWLQDSDGSAFRQAQARTAQAVPLASELEKAGYAMAEAHSLNMAAKPK